MLKQFKIEIILTIIYMGLVSYVGPFLYNNEIDNYKFQTIIELDEKAAFSFSIMGDNHGLAPNENLEMAKMAKWIFDAKDEFVIGTGDHISTNGSNSFIGYVRNHEWWHQKFYPGIGDAENEYYGGSKSDWGVGKCFYDELDIHKRNQVKFNDNGVEYYAKIPVKGFMVHLITLHYPEEPFDDSIAFPEASRKYLITTIEGIKKTDKDIVIVNARSKWGFWYDFLSDKQKEILNTKTDLLISGSTHYFGREIVEKKENSGALILNAGSATNGRFGSPSGFIQVHVLENPNALIVQYQNLNNANRTLNSPPYSFVKLVNGAIYPVELDANVKPIL